MQHNRVFLTVTGVMTLSVTAFAQTGFRGYEVCGKVITDGLRNYSLNIASDSALKAKYDAYCEGTSTKANLDTNADFGLPIEEIPVKFKGQGNFGYQAVKNFCRTYYEEAQRYQKNFSYEERIVEKGYDTFRDCMAIVSKGGTLIHEQPNLASVNFFVEAGRGQKIKVDGIELTPATAPVACNVTVDGKPGPKTIAMTRKTSVSTSDNSDNRLNITCTRTPEKSDGGEAFEEEVVTVATTLGNYSVLLPQDAKLPEKMASQIQAQIGTLQKTMQARIDKLTADLEAAKKTIPTGIRLNPVDLGPVVGPTCAGGALSRIDILFGSNLFKASCVTFELIKP